MVEAGDHEGLGLASVVPVRLAPPRRIGRRHQGPAVVEKIVEGKLGSFYSQIVLIDQPSVRDPNVTVSQLIAQASAKTGENITVSRFARFKVGEHVE